LPALRLRLGESEPGHHSVDAASSPVDDLLVGRRGAGWVAERHPSGGLAVTREHPGIGRGVPVGSGLELRQHRLALLALGGKARPAGRRAGGGRRSNPHLLDDECLGKQRVRPALLASPPRDVSDNRSRDNHGGYCSRDDLSSARIDNVARACGQTGELVRLEMPAFSSLHKEKGTRGRSLAARVARPARIELAAPRLGGGCSIR
jgi:hypothetical protein